MLEQMSWKYNNTRRNIRLSKSKVMYNKSSFKNVNLNRRMMKCNKKEGENDVK